MKDHQSPEEFMQEVLPGSKTFPIRLLCPCCGWHFKHGVTDPTGSTGKLIPGILLVCGQCLRSLRTNDKLELVAMTQEEIEALPDEDRMGLAKIWEISYLSLLLTGPEPKGTKQ